MGFHMPEFPVGELKNDLRPWQAVAHIEIGAAGLVEHVFLIERADEPTANAVLLRNIRRGRLSRIGEKCSGRVTVVFGKR